MSRYTLTIATLVVITLTFCIVGEYHDIQNFESNQHQIHND